MSAHLDPPSGSNSPHYRHPATVLLLALISSSYLFCLRDAVTAGPGPFAPLPVQVGSLSHILFLLKTNPISCLAATLAGLALFVFPRSFFDRWFGLRSQPCYRFGLRELLVSMAVVATLFAAAARWRPVYAAALIVALAIPVAVMGIAVWVDDRQRRIRRNLEEPEQEGKSPADMVESDPS